MATGGETGCPSQTSPDDVTTLSSTVPAANDSDDGTLAVRREDGTEICRVGQGAVVIQNTSAPLNFGGEHITNNINKHKTFIEQHHHHHNYYLGNEPEAAVTFDPMSSTTEPRPSVKTSVEGDRRRPEISAMISYLGAVFMADNINRKIKVFSLTAPHQLLHCLPVDGKPWGLAMVTGRQLLAVTLPSENRIQLIDVTATPVVGQSIRTHRRYRGVGSCDERTLVVSCPRDEQLPASVDIITLEGEVVRTVTSSDEVRNLVSPWFLCVSGGTIYISDSDTDCVHQTDMETGQLTTLPRHPKLKTPLQVTVDPGDNMYVVSFEGRCVLVRTAAGEWRELLPGERHEEGGWVYPLCVCVTDTGLLLVRWGSFSVLSNAVVKVYQFT